MIDLSQSTLAALLFYSVFLGVALGVFYDAVRFIKLLLGIGIGAMERCGGFTFKRVISEVIVFAFDVIFWIVFAISSLILTYNVSGGVFRGMVYFGMISGGALYYFTVGRLTLKLGDKLARMIRRIAGGVIRFVLAPLRAIFYFVLKIYHLTIGKIIGKIICVMRTRRQAGKAASDDAAAVPQNIQKENNEDVTKYRYEREGRISFGQSSRK